MMRTSLLTVNQIEERWHCDGHMRDIKTAQENKNITDRVEKSSLTTDHQWPNITSYCNWKLSFMYINWTKMWLWRVFHCIVQCTRGMSGRVVKVIDFWPKALYNWSNTRLQYILSSFKTRMLTRVTQWVPLVKQELSTISEQLSTQLVFHLFVGFMLLNL
jgi:hypothetical protein